MAFEFFFGVLGLISSDSKSRHKSRLESEWRLPTPLNANLFRESGLKSPLARAGSPGANFKSTTGGGGGSKQTMSSSSSSSASDDQKRPIFSTSGTLGAANSGSVSEGIFSSASSSSASSIASSGSNLTTNSTSAFIKPAEHTKKYEFRLNLIGGDKSAGLGLSPGLNHPSALSSAKLSDDSLMAGLASKGTQSGATTTTGSSSADLLSEGPNEALGSDGEQETSGAGSTTPISRTQQLRRFYCLIICAALWLQVMRLIFGLLIDKSLVTLDFFCLGAYKVHFLIPAMCLAIQAAAVSTLFIRNNDETNWLVPFYSSKDYLIRSRSNFKPKIEDYTKRVNVSIALALVLALVSSISLSAYLVHCVGQSDIMQQTTASSADSPAQAALPGPLQQRDKPQQQVTTTITTTLNPIQFTNNSQTTNEQLELSVNHAAGWKMERVALATLLALDVLWAVYSTYICFLVSFYFNLICAIMKSRFHGISKIIEDLAESNTTKTTNQARKITTLYLEHNEACELLDESNDFWQYLIFFTYFTYIPAYCYCLYNLFFVDFEAWPSFITWVIHTHTGFIILLISFSAAGVSTEAHAPYTSLHTLSLIQLPLDVEVNIATFLHRVRGLTIGYSCYDLFAITNASMSNTAAACASYFLIVADFSRSSVFTLAQMNGSATAGSGALTTPAPVG